MSTSEPGGAPPPSEPTPEPKTPPANPEQVARERRGRGPGWHSRDVVRTAALVIGLYVLLKLLWFANTLVLVAFLGMPMLASWIFARVRS